ncbi:MAG: S9 family peptidase [Acidobacteria bacterium]|nr:MAG: S9 family peptidase [Acidobacteriota bacterium]PYU42771.1 MAG: S9 family peptidase [Acidobacteriota bacterium]PYU65621.1 MAG: S9 family peptidase [Acidobacteriota bacterium]PYU73248.1 MAG: S9 family peptidase [Acidobacteriota bacterium]
MKLAFRLSSLSAVLVLAPLALAQQPAPRAITIDDYFQIREVRDPQLSPDAKWVAYSIKTVLLKEDKNEERIWIVPTAGGDPLALTADGVSSAHARWRPDGKFLAFLSARDEGKTQVWLLNRLGGDAERLTDTPQDVQDFAWSPDSSQLVLVLRDASSEELEAAKENKDEKVAGRARAAESEAKDKKKAPKPWVIDRLQFKLDEVGYLDRRRTHLYVFDLDAKSLRQITSGDYDDSEPAWSPDGKWLAFSSNRSVPDPDATYDQNIWVVPASNSDKGAHPTQVTTNPGADGSPAWSPDGEWIAYVTQMDPHLFDYATKHLAVAPATGGEAKLITLALDRMVTVPRFSPDGKYLYFIADDDGTQNLCRVPVTGGEIVRPVGGRLMVNDYSLAKTGDIVAQIATLDHPDELYTIPDGKLTRITHTNDALMSQLKLSYGQYVHFKSKDGTIISGYLYKPVDYVPGKKYPTILRPHGGPVWAYYAEFDHLPQLLAANGYAVLFPNPRGSTGYGQDFAKAIWADWGNKDFQDDMAMVDYAIEQGIADPAKLAVGGWSYGGISTDFIIAQTNRFKAAISGAGSALFSSFYGHDQYQRDYEAELGHPWENKAVWERVSPFYKVANVSTPTLFMGGAIDWNVPILGGEQMYQALKRLGRATELVVYPGEYHEFKTPSHIKDRLERYLAWYAHFVKGDSTPARPVPTPKSGE